MTKIIISGANGKMGKVVADCVEKRNDIEVVAGVDINTESKVFPIYDSFEKIQEKADVVVDFSHPSVLPALIKYCVDSSTAAVIATTGLTDNDIENVKTASKLIPIFFSFNMSLGVNLLLSLAQKAASVLTDGFDVEIIEKHHNQKIDAPSGTALMIADAINDVYNNEKHYEYNRHEKRQKRDKDEIGIHSVRGGTIVGEHEIMFAGHDEVITLSHSAFSKEVFAVGAVNAAAFLNGKQAGLYDMHNLVNEK